MKRNSYMTIERPSKAEFVLDNLFAIELLVFPYIFLVFRKPTWISMIGAVIISVLCAVVALVACLYASLSSKRSKGDICLNMLTIVGVTAMVLYAEWFPVLCSIVAFIMFGVAGWTFYYIYKDSNAPKKAKRRMIRYSRQIIAAVSILLILVVICLRVIILIDIKDRSNRFLQPVERHRIELVDQEYIV